MAELTETAVAGAVPRFEVPGWRERFGVVAGITGRGESAGRGFDLGFWSGAPVGEVMSRWRAFRSAEPGIDLVVLGNQVHGADVAVCADSPTDHGSACPPWLYLDGIDGHVTARPGVLLTVTVADCVPVYLVAPARGVALLHAGWRGTAAGILRRGVDRLTALTGVPVSEIVMHCGVAICGPCYEVGSEVVSGCGLPVEGSGPWHVDLRNVLLDQAERLGIREATVSSWCTAHQREHFYSHRASGGTDGRMVAYLGKPDLPVR